MPEFDFTDIDAVADMFELFFDFPAEVVRTAARDTVCKYMSGLIPALSGATDELEYYQEAK